MVSVEQAIPMAISGIALAVSGLTLWLTKLTKARIKLRLTNRVQITVDPRAIVGGRASRALVIRVVATNSGAQFGFIEDLALRVSPLSSESPFVMRSLFESVDTTLNLTSELTPPRFDAFTGFPVAPGQSVVKTVMFVESNITANNAYALGKYKYELLVLAQGDERFRLHAHDIFDVDEEDLSVLGTITNTNGLVNLVFQNKSTMTAMSKLQDLEHAG